MKESQLSIMFTSEEYELLMKEAGRRQALTGKKTYLTSIVREQIEPYLTSLRNGDSPDTKQIIEQPIKQDIEQPTQAPANRNMMDFSDLDLD